MDFRGITPSSCRRDGDKRRRLNLTPPPPDSAVERVANEFCSTPLRFSPSQEDEVDGPLTQPPHILAFASSSAAAASPAAASHAYAAAAASRAYADATPYATAATDGASSVTAATEFSDTKSFSAAAESSDITTCPIDTAANTVVASDDVASCWGCIIYGQAQ